MASACVVVLLGTVSAWATAADFAVDFVAAAPGSYGHATGNYARYMDGTVGSDIVSSLQGGDFRAGDIVSWLALITVRPGALGAQTIQLNFSFAAVDTGQPGTALHDVSRVAVNYPDPLDPADSTDSAIHDDGGSRIANLTQSLDGVLWSTATKLLCSFQVTDLEAGEKIVIRIDTRLARKAGSSPTGNLWGRLDSAKVVAVDPPPNPPLSDKAATISTGQQTVPFKKVDQILPPQITVVKTASLPDATSGVNPLTVPKGTSQVKYWFTVVNPGSGPLFNVTLYDVATDASGNELPGSSHRKVDLSGLDAGYTLAAGQSAIGSIVVDISGTLPIYDMAVASGLDASSGATITASAMATVQVTPNKAPVANNDGYSMDQDTTLTVPNSVDLTILANDTDQDGDPLTVDLGTYTNPSHGNLTLNADGSFTYTPTSGFVGTDTFTYKANDGTVDSDNFATVTTTVNHVNHAPVAKNDQYPMMQGNTLKVDATPNSVDPNVLANDTDQDGDKLTASLVAGPSHGTLSLNTTDGSFTYKPDKDFAGIDTFTYTANDGQPINNVSNVATVIIIVNAVTSRHISVDLQVVMLTYASPSLSGSFTITNTSNGKRAIKVDQFSLLSIQYTGVGDTAWTTVPIAGVTGLTFTFPPEYQGSLADGASVTVTFECSLPAMVPAIPAVAAFMVDLGAQVEQL